MGKMSEMKKERDEALRLAVLYLSCLVNSAVRRGQADEPMASWLQDQFAKYPWLAAEYGKLLETETAAIREFFRRADLI